MLSSGRVLALDSFDLKLDSLESLDSLDLNLRGLQTNSRPHVAGIVGRLLGSGFRDRVARAEGGSRPVGHVDRLFRVVTRPPCGLA